MKKQTFHSRDYTNFSKLPADLQAEAAKRATHIGFKPNEFGRLWFVIQDGKLVDTMLEKAFQF